MNRQRLFAHMQRENLDYLVLDSSENVSYVTGMGVPVPYGALFAYGGGMPLAYGIVSLRDRAVTLIASDFFADYAANATAERVVLFAHYDHFRPTDGMRALDAALRGALPGSGRGQRAAVEGVSCPAHVWRMLETLGFEITDAQATLRYARKIKTAEEMEKIRRSAAIEDCGQNRLLEYARNFRGETDFEMWSGITQAMNQAAGKVARISGELAVGRNAEIRSGLGGPDGVQARLGDMGRMDISIRYHGYWCDCTNTVSFGRKPDPEQRRYFQIVREAYEAAKAQLVPGKPLSAASAAEAGVYRRYGMHPLVYTGHQIGCGVNEPERIVCYADEMVEPGMVVCIEPQQYGPAGSGIGVRLEKVIAITEHGPEEINRFVWGDEIWN